MIRRDFIKFSLFTAAFLSPVYITAKMKQDEYIRSTVLICGGGIAGLSTAKYLKELNPDLNVVLIEKNPLFISCTFSNAFLGGLEDISFESLCFDYNSSINAYKYKFLNETIVDIKRDEKIVITNKSTIKYEYLVMAVGIDYDYKELYKTDTIKAKQSLLLAPPGFKAGSETLALKRMIKGMTEGNFVISIPSSDYKCLSAPYERACMIAHYFKSNNINAKVIIIDERSKPASNAQRFLQAFNEYYYDIIEYRNMTILKDVDFDKNIMYLKKYDKQSRMYLTTELRFSEASIIPRNIANKLIRKARLKTSTSGWAKVQDGTFRSITDDDVYVIGDTQGNTSYPKTAQMANSIAKIISFDLIARLNDEKFDYTTTMPENISYSIINDEKAISLVHSFSYTNELEVKSAVSQITYNEFISAKMRFDTLNNDIFALN